MNFHTCYSHNPGHSFRSDKPSMTDSQYKEECDINAVVDRALRGNVPGYLDRGKGSFGDVSQYTDFRQMMDVVDSGTRAFMEVPSAIRARFGNDPRAFYAFVCDPANHDECVRLGLAMAPAPAPAAVSPSDNSSAPA